MGSPAPSALTLKTPRMPAAARPRCRAPCASCLQCVAGGRQMARVACTHVACTHVAAPAACSYSAPAGWPDAAQSPARLTKNSPRVHAVAAADEHATLLGPPTLLAASGSRSHVASAWLHLQSRLRNAFGVLRGSRRGRGAGQVERSVDGPALLDSCLCMAVDAPRTCSNARRSHKHVAPAP